MEIRSLATIQTPDQVNLTVELAGVGGRVFAFMIDFLVLLFLMALLMLVLFILSHVFVNLGLSKTLAGEGLSTVGPLMLLSFLFGFHFLQEWLGKGKTVGKSLMKIRVVRNNGQPIGFWEAFGRNLFRLVDVYVGGIGLFPLLISKTEKRFGDYLVGTIVIQEDALKYRYQPQVGIQPLSSQAGGHQLTVEEYQLLQEFMSRQRELLKGEREDLDRELRSYFQARFQLSESTVAIPEYLQTLLGEFRASDASSF